MFLFSLKVFNLLSAALELWMVLCIVMNLWQELQEKLDLMNKQQPQGHDEL